MAATPRAAGDDDGRAASASDAGGAPLLWGRWFWPYLAVVLAFDQLTKNWLFAQPVAVPFNARTPGPIPGFPAWIDRSYNPGVAWGVGHQMPGAVALLTAFLVPVLAWIWWRHFRKQGRWENLAFGVILGGALGNGIDRALANFGELRGVRDFIFVNLGFWPCNPWPTFNIADAGISTGFVLLAVLALARPKPAPPVASARAVV